MAPLFSVVIPAHESAGFIGGTIERVLAQTFDDFEVVVLDNGSTDGTGDVVAGFGDPRIRYQWQEDSGLPANSRNVAVSMSEGEYVAFLDADDIWHEGKLARIAEVLEEDPGIDVVAHGVEVVTPEGKRRGKRTFSLEEGEDVYSRLLYRGNFLTTSATTVRRTTLLAQDGFDERPEYVTVEDYDLWLRIARDGGRFVVLPEILGGYVVHKGGESANLRRHYDNQFRVLDAHYTALAKTGALDIRAARRRRERARLAEARDLLKGGALLSALRVLAGLPGEVHQATLRYRGPRAVGTR